MTPRKRRSARTAVGAFLIATVSALGSQATPAFASDAYPTRTIRMVVGYAPGGGADILARLLSQPLAQELGQPVVVENRPGAGQNIAASLIARSPADGYSLLMSSSAMSVNVSLYAKIDYDPVSDFSPVAVFGESPNLLLVGATQSYRSAGDLVQFARDNPGKLNFSSSDSGSTQHLSGELLKLTSSISMTHIPYKGTSPSLNAVASGEVDLTFSNLPSAKVALEAGRIRAIAITSPRRSPLYPEVPTMIEAGFDKFEVAAWYGVMAPAGTPKSVVDRLNKAINAIVSSDDFKQRMQQMGIDTRAESPADFARFLNEDISRWRAVIQSSKITND